MLDQRWFAWALVGAAWAASCGDTFVRIKWEGSDTVTVPGLVLPDGATLPDSGWPWSDTGLMASVGGADAVRDLLLLDPSFDDAAVDLEEALEDVHLLPFDLSDAYIRSLHLAVQGPGDLSFLAQVTVWFEHGGARTLVASRYFVGPGVRELDLFLEDVELSREILAGPTRLVFKAVGAKPLQDTAVEVSYRLSFGVTRQGACGVGRIFGGR